MEKGIVDFLLVPQEVKSKSSVVLTLVRGPEGLAGINPLAPVVMTNAARTVSNLTDSDPGAKIGVVLRSCESRALVELVKLKQATWNNLVIIGIDCVGTFDPPVYRELVRGEDWDLEGWLAAAANGETAVGETEVRNACLMCDHVTAEHADINIGWVGLNPSQQLIIEVDEGFSELDKLNEQAPAMGLKAGDEVTSRKETIDRLRKSRGEFKEKSYQEFIDRTSTLSGMVDELASCIRCYNCRQACPICFCQECVFVSPIFKHDSSDYLKWAERKSAIEMPTDTLLFHMTRVNHIGTSCVGCGHCESACPSKIPLTLLFGTASKKVQDIFSYVPGRDLEEPLPQTTYQEDELEPR